MIVGGKDGLSVMVSLSGSSVLYGYGSGMIVAYEQLRKLNDMLY